MGINKSTFYYDLPGHLIAQEPLGSRSASRLLVLDRKSGEMRHRKFDDISDYLKSGDCLVINDTKVMPARLMGVKKTGAVIEVLLLKRLGDNRWEALVKPGRRVRNGDIISFGDGLLTAEAEEVLYDGVRVLKLDFKGVFEEILDTLGEMPLPPYITKKLADKSRYQTVYAERTGSAAAPTAGLHFTEKLIGELKEKGVIIAKVTLHVGLGTFRPIKSENILDHEMHSEYYKLDKQNADIINKARVGGGRIICVGTTSVRTLETIADENGNVSPQEGFTDIFIYPANPENPDSIGYKFKITDALITNFHLPESTLMALVSAFAGTESIIGAYKTAVRMEYRFFSFGDAMIIV